MSRNRILQLLCVLFLMFILVGCHKDKALYGILENAQYERYKPQLDHMVEKYGDMFEMDVYGQVSCTNPAYKDWIIKCDETCDNFAIRLR